MQGGVGEMDQILAAELVLTISSVTGVNPLGPLWETKAGPGPAKLKFDMV